MKRLFLGICLVLFSCSHALGSVINYEFILTVDSIPKTSPCFELGLGDSIIGNFSFDSDLFPDDASGGDAATNYGFMGQVQIENFDNYFYSFSIQPNKQIASLCFYDNLDYMLFVNLIDYTFEFSGEDFITPVFHYNGHFEYLTDSNPIEPITSTPEPTTFILIGLGLSGFAGYKKKSKKSFQNI
jgi:hypothetical protein